MKKVIVCCSIVFLFLAVLAPFQAAAAPPISTHAQAAALIDVTSGRILYSQQGDKPLRIASLTKVMTAIVAIERGKLSDSVKVSKEAYGKEGSSIYLKLGEEMSLQHLLYGLMLRSGNDAATAIAEHVGGSVDGFVYMMNEQARMIGMPNTTFKNPHGLDDEGHLSSANDMAKLTAYALKNPVFQDIVKTKVKKVPNPNESWDYTWLNKNKMLNNYDGADGVKTGYTKLAKRCLISSATRGGQQLAVVTLNDGDDWADHGRLLDYGFKYFPQSQLAEKGGAVQGTPFVAGADFRYPATQEERTLFSTKTSVVDQGSVAYRLGERGTLELYLNNKQIGSVPLYEPGSPLLKKKNDSAFKFQETAGQTGMAYRFLSAVRSVMKVLFTGEAS